MRKLKIMFWIIVLFCLFILALIFYFRTYLGKYDFTKPRLTIEKITVLTDEDNDQINDQEDILLGAKQQIGQTIKYEDGYYQGGYPPEELGVCSDVIWRALQAAGFDLKKLIDQDIKNNPDKYPRVNNEPEPNIDFRRVINLQSFFERHSQQLITKLIPWDKENLFQWQGGDIIIFDKLPTSGKMHIAIISNKRRADGIPYIIHNYCCGTMENDLILLWPSKIIGHYRYP